MFPYPCQKIVARPTWDGLAIDFVIIIQVQNTSFIKSNNCVI